MNSFIEEYLRRLRKVENDQHIENLYSWFWDNKKEVARTSQSINAELSLKGRRALQPDLPCLTIGSRNGLLILAANPSWSKDSNAKEEQYCGKSKEQYVDLMLNFFALYPQPKVVGKRNKWWSQPMGFVELLKNGKRRWGSPKSAKEKWLRADQTRLVGGWELFPFHSEKDGISSCIQSVTWLADCARESILAAIRLNPEVLLITSKPGWEIATQYLPNWNHSELKNGKNSVQLWYCRMEKTEVVAIPYQIFSAPRKFTNQQIFQLVDNFRSNTN